MLQPEQYAQLYQALATRGIQLINDPAAYLHCHYLPESYSVLEGYIPTSVWLRTGLDAPLDQIMELLAPFDAPVVVKDFVKSRKHEWAEACYIPSAETGSRHKGRPWLPRARGTRYAKALSFVSSWSSSRSASTRRAGCH